MTSYFGREQRIRDLMNIIQDERYTRTDITSILDVCLRHLVPHNHNNYTININHRYPTYPGQVTAGAMETVEGLGDHLGTNLETDANTTNIHESEPISGSTDLNTTIQNFVENIMNEVSTAPSDSVRVHVNPPTDDSPTGEVESTTTRTRPLMPVSLDMMITDVGGNLDTTNPSLSTLDGVGSGNTTIRVRTNTSVPSSQSGDTSSEDDTGVSDVAHDSQEVSVSENHEATDISEREV